MEFQMVKNKILAWIILSIFCLSIEVIFFIINYSFLDLLKINLMIICITAIFISLSWAMVQIFKD